ncbi:MAG: hypothetical protein J7647_30120 [Cyanobacteria bacterium SBLK]|nr:hypothetical protein [Cyanobacteria bacterium SBLK]
MKGKAFNAIGLMILLGSGTIALPSRGQDLNAELDYAVCNQNWDEAIAIIDRARETSPQSDPQLEAYRDRLVALKDSAARAPGWGGECTLPPSATIPAQPATTASPSLADYGTMVAFLDHLKACKSYRYGGGFFGALTPAIEIGGQNRERCAMRQIYGDGSQMQCQLSQEGIAVMTNEIAYENARIMDEFQQTGNLDTRDMADNPDSEDIVNKECRYIDPPSGS